MPKCYEQNFRRALGFTNQDKVKKYFKATDCVTINWNEISLLNDRLKSIFTNINNCVHESIRVDSINAFLNNIDDAYEAMRVNNILPRLNNFGRAPEDVYYNWMRGYCVAIFFSKAISLILNVDMSAIQQIGMDDLDNIETFSQSPMADIEVQLPDESRIRFEVQSGYTGVNDIKKHKVEEGKRVFIDTGIRSYVIHFDLFNGKVAIIDISEISETNTNYRENERFEGQMVFSIPSEAFKYRLLDAPPSFESIVY